ncbi:hypothetical protein ACEWY4_019584 [Coilia grayii]|uniref:Hepcidin n=1 Tax=Coilia grayii TaxID=363190 RepID=A0ABD1JDC5_9TELE
MRSFTTFAAVTVLLTCICILNCSAVPFSEVQPGKTVGSESEIQEMLMTSPEITNSLEHLRTKRHISSHLSLCRYCCNCCHNKGCGFCCRF